MLSKLKKPVSPLVMLALGLTIVTLLTAIGGLASYNHEIKGQLVNKAAANIAASAGKASAQRLVNRSQAATAATFPQSASGQVTKASFKNIALGPLQPGTKPSAGSSNNQATSTAAAILAVTLSVNGKSKGVVKMPAGSNQCDVLSQALADGLISSLDMRYSNQYKTEAVYVIDGVGDPGSVWWTYTVNGRAPPYGCGYTAVQSGDVVNWRYVKS